jgi:uncharacterized coiled-coil protein SlyX
MAVNPKVASTVELPEQSEGGPQPSTTNGGGDTYDGMEPRVARLEASVAHMERDVGELRGDMRDVRDRLARLEERVGNLFTKSYLDARIVALLAVVAALVAFQQQIQSFIGSGP